MHPMQMHRMTVMISSTATLILRLPFS